MKKLLILFFITILALTACTVDRVDDNEEIPGGENESVRRDVRDNAPNAPAVPGEINRNDTLPGNNGAVTGDGNVNNNNNNSAGRTDRPMMTPAQ